MAGTWYLSGRFFFFQCKSHFLFCLFCFSTLPRIQPPWRFTIFPPVFLLRVCLYSFGLVYIRPGHLRRTKLRIYDRLLRLHDHFFMRVSFLFFFLVIVSVGERSFARFRDDPILLFSVTMRPSRLLHANRTRREIVVDETEAVIDRVEFSFCVEDLHAPNKLSYYLPSFSICLSLERSCLQVPFFSSFSETNLTDRWDSCTIFSFPKALSIFCFSFSPFFPTVSLLDFQSQSCCCIYLCSLSLSPFRGFFD